jgi:hypothetical protein
VAAQSRTNLDAVPEIIREIGLALARLGFKPYHVLVFLVICVLAWRATDIAKAWIEYTGIKLEHERKSRVLDKKIQASRRKRK